MKINHLVIACAYLTATSAFANQTNMSWSERVRSSVATNDARNWLLRPREQMARSLSGSGAPPITNIISAPARTTNSFLRVGERGSNYCTWLSAVAVTNKAGQMTWQTNRAYVELATGMNYRENGEWKESREQIEAVTGGAMARQGAYNVIFANNLNTAGAIDVQMPDGQRLRSHVLGLAYFDPANGQGVLIAQVKDSQGRIGSSNQIVYVDAFDGVKADVRYTYKRGSFEQDIILRERPPEPANYGLNPETTRLEVITEFLNPPARVQKSSMPASDAEVNFGAMRMGPGKAFDVNLRAWDSPAKVEKHWLKLNTRDVLIETVPVKKIKLELQSLPVAAKSHGGATLFASRDAMLQKISSPPVRIHEPGAKMQLAQTTSAAAGLVLDYILLNADQTDYTFFGDVTYYITGPVYISGTTTVEGGTTIKYAPQAEAKLSVDNIVCKTEAYHPAILTTGDDYYWGYPIPGPVGGWPLADYFADTALEVGFDGDVNLHDLRIMRAETAIHFPWQISDYCTGNLKNLQILHCARGVKTEGNQYVEEGENKRRGLQVHNCLIVGVESAFEGDYWDGGADHITVDGCTWFATDSSGYFDFSVQNSVLANVENLGDWVMNVVGDHNGLYNTENTLWPGSFTDVYTETEVPFQSSGAGNYYLRENSPFRGVGTTMDHYGWQSLAPILANLKTKTTHPPLRLPEYCWINCDLTLFPEVARYVSGAPDLGYHYDAVDYDVADAMVLGAITVEPGTAVGFHQAQTDMRAIGFGFDLLEGSSFLSHGTPEKPNVFADIRFVQEQDSSYACNGFFVPFFRPYDTTTPPPKMDFRFCNFYASGSQSYYECESHVFWGGYDPECAFSASLSSRVNWVLRDCNVRGGAISMGLPDEYWYYGNRTDIYGDGSIQWINNSFENVTINVNPSYYWWTPWDGSPNPINCDLSFEARNNRFYRGWWFILEPIPASAGNWVIKDNVFEKILFAQNPSMPLDHDNNAYWLRTDSDFGDWGIAWLAVLQSYPWAHMGLVVSDRLAVNNTDGGTDAVNDQVLASAPPYQNGPLGSCYLPTTSSLYQAGSRTAGDAGLAQYTVRTDQTKEVAASPVSIGLHYLATASSTSTVPKDTDGDGVADYIEDANGNGVVDSDETDPSLAQTESGVPDATSVIYDNVDLSGNGLVGRIKKALGMSAFAMDNPLSVSQVTTGEEPDLATFIVPISFEVIDNIGSLILCVDGTPISNYELVANDDGNCRLIWNTTFDPPGNHLVNIRLNVKGNVNDRIYPPEKLNASGVIRYFPLNKMLWFNPFYCTFHDQGLLHADLSIEYADYSISLYDPSQPPSATPLKVITGTTMEGVINETWDVTDTLGRPYTSDSVRAVFNVSEYGQSSAGGGNEATTTLNKTQTTSKVPDGEFTVAQFKFVNGDHPLIKAGHQISVVNRLLKDDDPDRYTSSFNNVNQNSGGVVSDTAGVASLKANLAVARNFYFFGHGSSTELTSNDGSVKMTSKEVGSLLHNGINPQTHSPDTPHAYRFVFLNACHTADDLGWTTAFGIVDRMTMNEMLADLSGVQAFLGWDGPVGDAPETDEGWSQTGTSYGYQETLAVFFDSWMKGATLSWCMEHAAMRDPFGDHTITLNYPLGASDNPKIEKYHLVCHGWPHITRRGAQIMKMGPAF